MRLIIIMMFSTIALLPVILSAQNLDSLSLSRYRAGRGLYEAGERERTGEGVPMDYAKAFELYRQSASLGYPMGEYSLGYMYYKGLGCTQDYVKAAELFRRGATQGMDNSMYFLGLCLRNGYGVTADKDSATYWLHLADSLGSRQARQELSSLAAENRSEAARGLLESIHNLALPQAGPANTFVRVPHRLPMGEAVAGRYKGYLVQYDWSGSSVIDTKSIELELVSQTGRLEGTWVEEGTDSFRFSAYLRGDSLAFDPVSYGRRDHYSPDTAVGYRLEGAGLNLVQGPGALYLAGNVSMFSPTRGEPSKPVVLALVRSLAETPIGTRFTFDKVYPNPFRDVLEVQFSLGATADVGMAVVGVAGLQVYLRPAQKLQTGSYSYRLQLPAGLAPGAYVLQLSVNGTPHAYKLLHL
ncbi:MULTISPECIES: hypothetical protein [Chitinophagaceae]